MCVCLGVAESHPLFFIPTLFKAETFAKFPNPLNVVGWNLGNFGEFCKGLNMPVLDVISAGAKAALTTTRNNKIGIIATNTTVNSNAYARAIHRNNPDTLVRTQAAPLLVPLVEEGWLEHEVTRLTVCEYLKPLLADGIDTLVLGCTHFPLLKPLIGREAGNVALVDSAITTAEETARVLAQEGFLNTDNNNPDYRFYVSDIPLKFRMIGERFLSRTMEQIEMVSLG